MTDRQMAKRLPVTRAGRAYMDERRAEKTLKRPPPIIVSDLVVLIEDVCREMILRRSE